MELFFKLINRVELACFATSGIRVGFVTNNLLKSDPYVFYQTHMRF